MATAGPRTSRVPLLIGWREHVSLPDFGIGDFVAKVDTGANYCALHATHIKSEDGFVSFRFDATGTHLAKIVKRKWITSSNGEKTRRYLIRTRVKIGKKTIRAEITLIDRSKMKDKMLLGRKFLRNRFIIDPKLSYALKQPRKRKPK